jgi:hypothetical protein
MDVIEIQHERSAAIDASQRRLEHGAGDFARRAAIVSCALINPDDSLSVVLRLS